jgi:hypothetical protein
MPDRRVIDIKLYDVEACGSTAIDTTVPRAIDWLSGLLARIPEQFVSESYFILEGSTDRYGDMESNISIGYRRPETDEELAAREAADSAKIAAEAEAARLHELSVLAWLKEKYGDAT